MLGSLSGIPPNNLQQQPQQQQSQQQPQPQPQQNSIPPPPPQNGQDFTLSSVLHFLQTEWRRYERDRNEWEIERAEMRARIALLEGERRSFENVKLDLMRRVKMLEYALRMERSKQLTQPSGFSTSSSKIANFNSQTGLSLQKEDGPGHKEDSSGSSPRSDDSPLPDTRLSNGISGNASLGRPSSWGNANWSIGPAGGSMTNLGKPPPGRDPKSRARSRDYLKHCLQEISYLTSPQAMNPLPNRPLLSNPPLPLAMPTVPPFESMPYNQRPPRKVLPEVGKEFAPAVNGSNPVPNPSLPPPPAPQPTDRNNSNPSLIAQHMQSPQVQVGQQTPPPQPYQPPSQPQGQSRDREKELESSRGSLANMFNRPEEINQWKDSIQQHQEAVEPTRRGAQVAPTNEATPWDVRGGNDEDGKDEDPEIDDDESTAVGEGEGAKVWKAKRTLRNHLDAVRALAFHPKELCLATGGDDCTVKIWRMEAAGLASSSTRPTTEVEPQLTLRGHSAAITRLIHAASRNLLYSASLDSSIRVWALPTGAHSTYAPYDESRARGELVGHTDAVWDLALVRDENTLISCGAEGAVKVWDVSNPHSPGKLKLSWGWHGLDQPDGPEDPNAFGATAVEALRVDLKKVAVAYQNAVVKIFNIETGKELMQLQSDVSYGTCLATH
ncbi:hypothetical protein AX16_008671 [Volvariella volvacea WC 439]|nr:hypothetical protein AX16_008671 [Volvariella volvacea WC 439]